MSCKGWKGDEIVATNYVEVGIKLPKALAMCHKLNRLEHPTCFEVPGLTNIMEYFVKSYGTQHESQ